jgi:heme exporter protein C
MRKLFLPIAILAAAIFAYAPLAIAGAPYESTMLLVQKIFYFHLPSWMALGVGILVCGVASAVYLFKGNQRADRFALAGAEIVVIFGLFGLVSGSLWARKAWGVWWQWDAKLTTAFILELVFLGYLLVRKYGGPGSDKLAAGMGIFGAAMSPFLYKSADWWRTVHPQTSVMRTLGETSPEMWNVVWICAAALLLLTTLLITMRVRLEDLRADLDELYRNAED